MEIITNIVTFVQQHWVDILACIGALDIILGVIVKLTPFDWDNNAYVIVHNLIAKLLGKKSDTILDK